MESRKEIVEKETEETFKATAVISKPGLDKFELMEEYKKWNSSISYNKVVKDRGYNGPRKTSQRLSEQIPDSERKSYKILDVGAGTGLVGEELQIEGFENLHALEPSEELLKSAKSKGIYKRYYQCFMTDDVTAGIENDKYDGVVTCGCFMENHLPIKALDEIIRIVKPGGVIVITTRLKYLDTVAAYKDQLEPYMKHLEQEGKWKLIHREIFPNYYREDQGITWVFLAQ